MYGTQSVSLGQARLRVRGAFKSQRAIRGRSLNLIANRDLHSRGNGQDLQALTIPGSRFKRPIRVRFTKASGGAGPEQAESQRAWPAPLGALRLCVVACWPAS